MQNISIDELILIREDGVLSGLQLWSYLLRKAINANFNVNIILFLHVKESLPKNILASNRYNFFKLNN